MKEVIYRDILGNNPRNREVSIEETSNRIKAKVAKKWACKYFVREKYSSSRKAELQNWVEERKKRDLHRNCHILRKLDTRTGENMVICKVRGEFFVIWGRTAYDIVYVNAVRIKIDNGR